MFQDLPSLGQKLNSKAQPKRKQIAQSGRTATGLLGDSSALPDRCYAIILANINRNVLLADRDVYVRHLTPGGQLLLSGIMEQDQDVVTQHYQAAGLDLVARNSRDGWVMLAFNHKGA